jgi:hypothetical protein
VTGDHNLTTASYAAALSTTTNANPFFFGVRHPLSTSNYIINGRLSNFVFNYECQYSVGSTIQNYFLTTTQRMNLEAVYLLFKTYTQVFPNRIDQGGDLTNLTNGLQDSDTNLDLEFTTDNEAVIRAGNMGILQTGKLENIVTVHEVPVSWFSFYLEFETTSASANGFDHILTVETMHVLQFVYDYDNGRITILDNNGNPNLIVVSSIPPV